APRLSETMLLAPPSSVQLRGLSLSEAPHAQLRLRTGAGQLTPRSVSPRWAERPLASTAALRWAAAAIAGSLCGRAHRSHCWHPHRRRSLRGQRVSVLKAALSKVEPAGPKVLEGGNAEVDDIRVRWLEKLIRGKNMKELKVTCAELGIAGTTKGAMVRNLTDPANRERVMKTLLPGGKAPPQMLPDTLAQVQQQLASFLRFPVGAGSNTAFAATSSLSRAVTPRAELMTEDLVQETGEHVIFDVRQPQAVTAGGKTKARTSLDSLAIGQELSGNVVAVSLQYGIRVDVGAEADALIPVQLRGNEELLRFVSSSCPLGGKVTIRVEELLGSDHQGYEVRRFPIVGILVKPSLPEA
ncbi:unnamed protein product, partial [Polarella glacialis]